jgi:hypothetical protein
MGKFWINISALMLKLAGRAPDLDHAVETAHEHSDDDFEIHSFFEIPKAGE